MTVEEINSEPPDGAGRSSRTWTVLAVLGVVALGAWFVSGGPGDDNQALPTPSASASSPTPSPTVQQRPGVADAELRFQGLCDPVVTARRLQLGFTLVNPDPVDVILLTVQPSLPLQGLEWLRTDAGLGGCGSVAPELVELRIPAGGTVLVEFTFKLPPTCPQPLPVGALVTTRVFDVSQSAHLSRIPLYPDLGSIDFSTCP